MASAVIAWPRRARAQMATNQDHPPLCVKCDDHVKAPLGGDSSGHTCAAFYNVVTGAQLNLPCEDARGDQMLCGRKGELFLAAQ